MKPHGKWGLRYFIRPSFRGAPEYVTFEKRVATSVAVGRSSTDILRHRFVISQSDWNKLRNCSLELCTCELRSTKLPFKMFCIAASSFPKGYSPNNKKYKS